MKLPFAYSALFLCLLAQARPSSVLSAPAPSTNSFLESSGFAVDESLTIAVDEAGSCAISEQPDAANAGCVRASIDPERPRILSFVAVPEPVGLGALGLLLILPSLFARKGRVKR